MAGKMARGHNEFGSSTTVGPNSVLVRLCYLERFDRPGVVLIFDMLLAAELEEESSADKVVRLG